jgi:Caspase domain
MEFNRRTFLKQTGWTLLSLGLSEAVFSCFNSNIRRYQQALAQTTNRKLALLVGINSYGQNQSLSGCLTDVELQRELLIHRFGFSDRDILILTEQQATRENIETAFSEHLNQQAKADDIVVFHYSGYGNRVKIHQSSTPEKLKNLDSEASSYKLANILMPVDGISTTPKLESHQLLEDTLMLLARSLPTDKLTTILDTSYFNRGKLLQGNLRLRSWTTIAEEINPEELAFSEKLRFNLASRKSLVRVPLTLRSNSFTPKEIVLSATEKGGIATEASWDGFNAGLFTYALTQYLWQVTPASKIQIAIARSAETVELITEKKQKPILQGNTKPLFTYYSLPESPVGAEGVVTKIDSKGLVRLRLTGLPLNLLRHYGNNSRFDFVNSLEQLGSNATLQIQSREGLTAKAQLISSNDRASLNGTSNANVGVVNSSTLPKVGDLVREKVRILPIDLGLTIALDPNLTRIEKVDATSAFSTLDLVDEVVDAGTQAADCLIGCIPKISSTENKTGYGLLSVGGKAIANTVGTDNEAVKSAIARLIPQFKILLANKICRLTVNEGSSLLPVNIILESLPNKNSRKIIDRKSQALIQKTTTRSVAKSITSVVEPNLYLPSIASDSLLQFKVENLSDRSIYLMLFSFDRDNKTFVFYSPTLENNLDTNSNSRPIAIASQTTSLFPHPTNSLPWTASSSSGFVEIYAICSIAPFDKTIAVLSTQQNFKQDREQIVDLLNPLEVSHALLADLHTASMSIDEQLDSSSSVYALNTQAWATLNFAYELVN